MEQGSRPRMMLRAMDACANSYAPYSGKSTGAAVLVQGGGIFSGCAVENASLGLSVCAERAAIVSAISETGPETTLEAIVIYSPTAEPQLPCGACRNVVSEFGPQAKVFIFCEGDEVVETTIDELLPSGSLGPTA